MEGCTPANLYLTRYNARAKCSHVPANVQEPLSVFQAVSSAAADPTAWLCQATAWPERGSAEVTPGDQVSRALTALAAPSKLGNLPGVDAYRVNLVREVLTRRNGQRHNTGMLSATLMGAVTKIRSRDLILAHAHASQEAQKQPTMEPNMPPLGKAAPPLGIPDSGSTVVVRVIDT